MSCSVAVLHFLECQHFKIFKLCCTTNHCDTESLCPPEKQRSIVAAKYKWSCQDCVDSRYAEKDTKRYAQLLEQSSYLTVKVDEPKDVQAFNEAALLEKAQYMEKVIRRRRRTRATESKSAEQWMWDFALTSLEVFYRGQGEEGAVDARGQKVLDKAMDDTSAAALDLEKVWLNDLIESKPPDLFIIRNTTGTAQEPHEFQSTVNLEDKASGSPAVPGPATAL